MVSVLLAMDGLVRRREDKVLRDHHGVVDGCCCVNYYGGRGWVRQKGVRGIVRGR